MACLLELTTVTTARAPRRRRSALSRFLFVHGPQLTGACALALAAAAFVADYVLIPDGFCRFVVAVIAYAVAS